MGLKRTLKRLGKAVPVIIANAPALADVVRQLRDALKTPEPGAAPAEPAPRAQAG